MMLATEARLNMLAGGLRVKVRVQHPQVKPRMDRQGHPWIFRYWFDEIQADGSVKTLRKYQAVGLSKGDGAITKKQAEVERDKFLAKLNAPTAELAVQQVAATGVASFERVSQLYIDGYLGREKQISAPTRKKELFYLRHCAIPRWGSMRLNQIQAQAVADWLHKTFDSDWTKHGVRAIMIRVFNHAEGYGLWEEGKRNPVSKAKLGKRRLKRERRILTFEETARVLLRLEEPYRLIVETCIATGARISEVLALEWKHLDLKSGTIKIEQRVWHQEISRRKAKGADGRLGLVILSPVFRNSGGKRLFKRKS